jgi:hypothetical protein
MYLEHAKNKERIQAECEHEWVDEKVYDLKQKHHHCPKCGRWQLFPVNGADKIEAINKTILEAFGNDDAVQFCNDIQYLFIRNNGKWLTFDEISTLWLDFRVRRLSNKAAFTHDLQRVLDILVAHNYIRTKANGPALYLKS